MPPVLTLSGLIHASAMQGSQEMGFPVLVRDGLSFCLWLKVIFTA